MFAKKIMASMYGKARRAEDLPWHHPVPPRLLTEAAQHRPSGGRALDVGCGAGTFAIYLAQCGFEVTGIDVIPRALEIASEKAAEEGVRIDFREADVLTWTPAAPFDLVLDSGCLHSLIGGDPRRYADRLRHWLAPKGDYVLGHWGRRHLLDWRPIGPRRRTKRELLALFSELTEIAYEETVMTDVPLPFGPTVLAHTLWLKRPA